jgi:hypothetical protein
MALRGSRRRRQIEEADRLCGKGIALGRAARYLMLPGPRRQGKHSGREQATRRRSIDPGAAMDVQGCRIGDRGAPAFAQRRPDRACQFARAGPDPERRGTVPS